MRTGPSPAHCLDQKEGPNIKAFLIAALALGSVACGTSSVVSTPHPTLSPSAQATLSASEQAELAQLAARPLELPSLTNDGKCPRGLNAIIDPYRDGSPASGPLYGVGPVYMQGGPKLHTSQYDYFDVTFFTDPSVKSLVLLRGQEIGGPYKVVFVGAYVNGPVTGTDTIRAQCADRYQELALPADQPSGNPNAAAGWGIWNVRLGFDARVTARGNCNGIQVDCAFGSEALAGP